MGCLQAIDGLGGSGLPLSPLAVSLGQSAVLVPQEGERALFR
jgi:hypothetical protein